MSEAPQQISFPDIEQKILARWAEKEIFKKTIDASKPRFSFYDGPPFATGLPHYGHLLASTLKDIVPRYWTMRGFSVERRWGWDCHGLPIEQLIDEKYQFKNSAEVTAFGIAKYNQECRDIVLRYTKEWESVVTRLGRWVDFKNGYRTMDKNFMETVWWVIRQLWDKGLIYRGYRVMYFSTPLGTPLSNFEASSNYQDVQDPAITVTFPLKDDPNTSILAWTTTPWTLPANLALAVGKDLTYARVREKSSGKKFICAEALLSKIFKADQIELEETFPAKVLLGKSYEPIFPYFAQRKAPHFTVIAANHVTTDAGTGIVHTAPAHGEEDYDAAVPLGIEPICPVDAHGLYLDSVTDFKGQHVKAVEKQIIADLKARGRLFKHETLNHSYRFCPRTDTPLIARTVAAWFVSVEKVKDQLVKNNHEQTNWIPGHLRDHRFGKWLEGAKDWNISRNRYWGNPLPIFEAVDEPLETRETFCVGSLEELEKLTGKKFDDIHREHLDDLVITKNGKTFKRVPEVLDCWFESGSMPYAQAHYPFENKEAFEKSFPAQFIAEGLDQTRGWFYTLSVLGTILFDKIPFQNVIVNGIVLAEDGKKMSKRLKNYPDPSMVMEKYGADALRLYLMDSPLLRAEDLRLTENGIKEMVRRVILKWTNAFSFLDSYAKIDHYKAPVWTKPPQPKALLDRWIISKFQSLLANVEREMDGYRLYNVVPEVLNFIEELTNTYIRLNRSRFWDEGVTDDKKDAFDTLHYVMVMLSKVMAPFAPFLSDHLYLKLTEEKQKESVHLEDYPRATKDQIDLNLEQGVALLTEVIELVRQMREQKKIKVKVPLKEIVIVHRKQNVLDTLKPLESVLLSELNVKKVTYRTDEKTFVDLQMKPNLPTLGPKVGAKMRDVSAEIAKLDLDRVEKLEKGEALQLCGFEITAADIRILRQPVEGTFPVASSAKVTVALDISISKEQELEGLAREVVNRIQKLRKDSGLKLDDRIHVEAVAKEDLLEAIKMFESYIKDQTLTLKLNVVTTPSYASKQDFDIDGAMIILALKLSSV